MIVIFDIETTGLNPHTDHILQLSAIKVDDDIKEVDRWTSYVKPVGEYTISPMAEATHGLTREFIEQQRSWIEIAPEFLEFIEGCDLCGFNSNMFDVRFLYNQLQLIGLELSMKHQGVPNSVMDRRFLDVRGIQTHLRPQTLGGIYKEYMGVSMEDAGLKAHDSMSDVIATMEILKEQVKQIPLREAYELEGCELISPEGSIRRVTESIVFNIGKYKDTDVYDVLNKDKGYMSWWSSNVATDHSRNIVREYCLKKMNTNV